MTRGRARQVRGKGKTGGLIEEEKEEGGVRRDGRAFEEKLQCA